MGPSLSRTHLRRQAESRAVSTSSKRQRASAQLSLSLTEYGGDVEQVSLNSLVTALLLVKVLLALGFSPIGIHSTVFMVLDSL